MKQNLYVKGVRDLGGQSDLIQSVVLRLSLVSYKLDEITTTESTCR